jgi:predicted transposase YdaD
MKNEKKKIHQPHDKGYKYILKVKSEFINLLKGFIKEKWVDSVSEENITMIDKSFIDTHFQSKEADIVYKYTDGTNETIFYVLLEHQSTVDNRMMFRLLVYMMEIWRDYLNEKKISIAPVEDDKFNKKDKSFQLPAIIPIVLHTGTKKWNAPVSFKEVIKNSEKYNGHIVDFKSLLIDTVPMKDKTFLEQESVVSLVMYLDKSKDTKGLLRKLMAIEPILNLLDDQERRMLVKWLRDVLMEKFDREAIKKIEEIIEETNPVEVRKMITNLERVIAREQEERYLAGIEKGIEKGVKIERIQNTKRLKDEKVKIALKLIKKRMSIDSIAEVTELNPDEVKKLFKDSNRNDSCD